MRERLAVPLLALAFLSGCSVKKMAVNSLGDALAEGGSTFASDDDPELVRDAVPFSLKTVESLLEVSPDHQGLLLTATSGFTQYGFAFLQQEADRAEEQDLARATHLRSRARKLYLRALEYGLRGLEAAQPGFREKLRRDPAAAVARFKPKHAPLLAWTANAWGAAMSISKENSELTADQALAAALMKRALELREDFEYGSGHDFFISYEGGRPASAGGSVERARQHYARSVELSRGLRAWPHVTLAESVAVGAQDRQEFEALLRKALAVDPDREKPLRLANLIAQERARWLLGRMDELFIE
jgi:predicted anti-sigma-YlaC factor YlaD